MSKKKKILIAFLVGLVLIATVYALCSTNIRTFKFGQWSQRVERTQLEILMLNHHVLPNNKVKSTIQIYNPTSEIINANVSIYYLPELAFYSFNLTIQPLEKCTESWMVSFNTSQWSGVEVLINEY